MSVQAGRRLVAAIIVLIALALLLPPFINVNRYRARMASSLSSAVGRPVKIGEVEMRLIPQPGFVMQNVEIGDDPAISNEPILRAEEVTADLRMASLWRGRLEIAKLSLKYPSFNVVRGNDGHWNIESLLWRASRTKAAPTGLKHAETRVRFPYIQADQGRVNFKFGLEKHVFAFTDADFALFSPEEDQWRMRLEARPVRTDTNISDTGTVKADINFQRAEMLGDTAVHGKISWQRGQLGMITKLINGRDGGWRGMLEMQAEVSGSPNELHFSTATSLQDFRRYDIYTGDTLALSATCTGVASIPAAEVRGFHCQMPTSPGSVSVSGMFNGRLKTYDVSVAAENVGNDSLVNMLRHAKKGVPADLSATGSLNLAAALRNMSSDPAAREWSGKGSTTETVLKSAVLKEPVTLKPLNIDVTAPAAGTSVSAASAATKSKAKKIVVPTIAGQFLTVSPFTVAMGGKTPATIDARLTMQGYEMKLSGPAELEHLVGFARSVGLNVPKIRLRGDATVDVALAGAWRGLAQPSIDGTAKITNGHAEVPGIAKEVLLTQSDVLLSGNQFELRGMQAQIGDLKFTGSAKVPRHCEADTPCGPGLDLQFDEVDAARVNELLNPNLKKQPWYKLFGSSNEESLLSKIYVVGRFTAKQVVLDKLVASRVYAEFRLNRGDLVVSSLRGGVLGGMHDGQWHADFTGATPVYTGSGTVTRINAAQLAALGKAAVGTGNINAKYELKMSGWNEGDFAKSADGSADFDWNNATIRAFALNNRGPSKVNDFTGKLVFKDGVLAFNESRMVTSNGIYLVTGTAEPEKLALEFKSNTAGYKMTGSLRAPEVATINATSEERKPKTEALVTK